MIRAIPNAITLLNLYLGSAGIVFLLTDKILATLICAALCLIFDMLDGLLARRLGATSALGVQLDSLADLVSFGVLPGCIGYRMLAGAMAETDQTWLPFLALLIPLAAALRLARFNIDTRDRKVFYGMPTPAMAICLFGFLLMEHYEHPWLASFSRPVFIVPALLLLSAAMLSSIRLWSFKGLGKPEGSWILGVAIALIIVLTIITGSAAIPLATGGYILFGLINHQIKIY